MTSYLNPSNEAPRELAAEILKQVRSHPDTHDQTQWGSCNDPNNNACKTTACIAGWAAILTGQAEYEYSPSVGNYHLVPPLGGDFLIIGQKALGLDDFDTSTLFYDCNDSEAAQALEYIVIGERIDWVEVLGQEYIDDVISRQ